MFAIQEQHDYDYDISHLNKKDIDDLESLLNKNKEHQDIEIIISCNMGGCLPKRLVNFSWIVSLDLTKCYLTTLQYLPPKLVNLILDDNFLKNIGNNEKQTIIPNSVEILSVRNNMVDAVHKLPNKLRAIDLSDNILETLHCQMPNSVEIVILSGNQLSDLPILGNNVRDLDISSNKIQYIKEFPQSLTALNCSNNILEHTNINFPIKLTSLNISKNILRNIDNILLLPNIESIDASDNNITHISSLPDVLTEIDLSENNLQEFPFTNIPANVTYINIKKNPKLIVPDEIKHNTHITLEYTDNRHVGYDGAYGSNYFANNSYDNSYSNNYHNQYNYYNYHSRYDQYGFTHGKEYFDRDNNNKNSKYNKSNANYIIMTKRIEI